MIARRTLPEEAQRVNELFAIAFEQPLENGPADEENKRVHHWAAFTDEGDMTGSITVTDFEQNFDGHSAKMGGIGGVASLPQYRRAGGIRACFETALPELFRQSYDFAYLYPFSTAYYRKFGFESCVQKYACTLDLSLLPAKAPEGSFRLAEQGRLLTDDIRAIDAIWERHYNMMIRHRAEDYAWADKADPAGQQEFLYVWYTAAREARAYTLFRMENQPDGRNLICSRFRFLDAAGFGGLLSILKSLAADHRFAKLELPAEPALQYLLPEWSMGAAQWRVQPAGMLRVVNAASALRMAAYRGNGKVTLQIYDAQIPENNNCFAICYAEGRALSVERTDAMPDAVLEISTFSALLAGVCDFSEAAAGMPGLSIRRENAPLGQVFYRKPLMIADYF